MFGQAEICCVDGKVIPILRVRFFMKLKYELQLDNLTGVIYTGVIRIIPRILPVSLLKLVYNILRK